MTVTINSHSDLTITFYNVYDIEIHIIYQMNFCKIKVLIIVIMIKMTKDKIKTANNLEITKKFYKIHIVLKLLVQIRSFY